MNAAHIACALLLLPCTLLSPMRRKVSKTAVHMGVEFEAVVYAKGSAATDRAFDKLPPRGRTRRPAQRLPARQRSFPPQQAGSAEPLAVGSDLIQVSTAARAISEGLGVFDVIVGATKLWRRARRLKEYPRGEPRAARHGGLSKFGIRRGEKLPD